MKQVMKKIIAVVLIAAMTSSFCSCGKNTNKKYVTRAEWVSAIGQMFGMSQHLDDTPHFKDVSRDSELYNYVQACYEWGVISTDSDKFNPDDVATLGFVVSSAVMLIENGNLESNDVIIDKAIEYGLLSLKDDNDKKLRRGVSYDEADALIVMTKDILLTPSTIIKNEVIVAESIKDYSDALESDIKLVEAGTYEMSTNIGETIAVGDILTVPGNNAFNDSLAVKVTEIILQDDNTYVVRTCQPELEDVVEKIDISGIRYIQPENIIPAEGVELVVTDAVAADTTAYRTNGKNALANATGFQTIADSKVGKNYEFKMKLDNKGKLETNLEYSDEHGHTMGLGFNSKGEINVVVENEDGYDISADIATKVDISSDEFLELEEIAKKNNVELPNASESTGMQLLKSYARGTVNKKYMEKVTKDTNLNKINAWKDIKPNSEYKAGYEFNTKIKLSNFLIEPEVKYNVLTGAKKAEASVITSFGLSVESSLKGKLSGRFLLADIKIPIAGPVTLDGKVYFYAEANGEVSVGIECNVESITKVCGNKEPLSSVNVSTTASYEVEVNLEVGGITSFGFSCLGLEIVSVGLKAGLGATFGVKQQYTPSIGIEGENWVLKETYTYKPEAAIYLPLVTVEINKNPGNLLAKLGVSAEKDLITKEKLKDKTGLGKLGIYNIIYDEEENSVKVSITSTTPIKGEEETDEYSGDYLTFEHLFETISVGQKKELKFDNIPKSIKLTDLVWESSDTSVATVDSKGVVSGIADGVASITASTKDGKYCANCMISVLE